MSKWDNNCTHLHCLAHSLNPKFYSHGWLNGGLRTSHKVPPHMDGDISQGGNISFRQIFHDRDLLDEVEEGLYIFSLPLGDLEAMRCSEKGD